MTTRGKAGVVHITRHQLIKRRKDRIMTPPPPLPEQLPNGAGEDGFSTAELLANAALGVAALVVLWGLFGSLGGDVVDFIRSAIGV